MLEYKVLKQHDYPIISKPTDNLFTTMYTPKSHYVFIGNHVSKIHEDVHNPLYYMIMIYA